MSEAEPPRYAPYYCEENVWWLARQERGGEQRAEVAIITNTARSVLFAAQRASTDGLPITWDYHVVLTSFASAGAAVWDLDCTLGMPLPARTWIDASFPASTPARLAPRFRVVPAERYVAELASDRHHMRRPDGSWLAPPPPWDPIGGGRGDLARWLDLDDPSYGASIDLRALRERWR